MDKSGRAAYNFANIPLNAAQHPLATARIIHWDLLLMFWREGISSSADSEGLDSEEEAGRSVDVSAVLAAFRSGWHGSPAVPASVSIAAFWGCFKRDDGDGKELLKVDVLWGEKDAF